MAGTCRSCSRSSQALQCTPMWMHANAGCREGRPRPRPATRCWHEMALMVTESCRHTNQLGTSKKTKTYIITRKNKNLHYAAPECVTTQPDVDSIALRVLLEKCFTSLHRWTQTCCRCKPTVPHRLQGCGRGPPLLLLLLLLLLLRLLRPNIAPRGPTYAQHRPT